MLFSMLLFKQEKKKEKHEKQKIWLKIDMFREKFYSGRKEKKTMPV